MKILSVKSLLIINFLISFQGYSQSDKTVSNIIEYTPSKLLQKGDWDVKWFNNLYTETKKDIGGVTTDVLRSNFFTSSLDIFKGISASSRVNIGLLLEFRSNTIGGRQALSVFNLKDANTSRKGLSSFAPAIKFQPFKSISNFSIQTAIHIPIISKETNNEGVFLDQTAYSFQNRFFYDYTFSSNQWQLFTELTTEYNFGEDSSFANNTFLLAPSVFLSYFPNGKSTLLGFVQHSERVGDFTQNYTAIGFGGKYQMTKTINLEILYSNFVSGKDNGLGQTFNIGLRYLLTK